jgi:hypothetical protein
MVIKSRQAIDKIIRELGEMPSTANEIIKFLNSKTKEDLEDLKVEDRTETILEVKRVLTKRGLMLLLEEKGQNMDIGVQRFFNKLETLQKKGYRAESQEKRSWRPCSLTSTYNTKSSTFSSPSRLLLSIPRWMKSTVGY